MGGPDGGAEPAGIGPQVRGEVTRHAALAVVARRWDVPLAVVVAPAGFGKSVLLRQAMEANGRDRRGIDHLVTCRPSDADAGRLAGRILAALAFEPDPAADEPEAMAQTIVAALGARSPQSVCLVLDDVHELGGASSAVALVDALRRELPANGHLLLAGRWLPDGVPLARLRAADQLVEVGEGDLVFAPSELAHLAASHGSPDLDVDVLGGWPALVRLGLTAGRAASMEFLRQEILDGLTPEVRRGLGVAILARGADDALLGDAGVAATAAHLARVVPLVEVVGSRAVPHALWGDVADQVVPDDERRVAARSVARSLRARGDVEDALELLARVGDGDALADAVLAALATDAVLMARPQAARWLALFPTDQQERPEALLLRGMVERLTAADRRDPTGEADTYFTDADDGTAQPGDDDPPDVLLRRAAAAFGAAQRPDGAAVALVLLLWSALDQGDATLLTDLRAEASALEERWPGTMGVYARVIDGLASWLTGDATAALATLDAVVAGVLPPSTRAFVELQRAAMCLAAGDDRRAVQATHSARQAAIEASGTEPVSQHIVISWLSGDPDPAFEILEGPQQVAAPSAQDRFRAVVYGHTFGASLGIAPPLDIASARVQGSGSRRDEVSLALAAAAVDASYGDDAGAAARLRGIFDAADLADPLVVGELRYFLPYVYVLRPDLRSAIDAMALGPLHVRTRALARLVVALREGGRPAWADVPPPPSVMTWLPLTWSVQVAVAAHGAGRAAGREIAVYLLDVMGESTRRVLRDLADGPDGSDAQALLSSVPAPPDEVVRVRVLGTLEVGHGEGAASVPSRRRVRELLALLVLRGEVTRDVAMATLWPDLDGPRARNNLNVTVRHLRSVIEPDRRAGEAPFMLRTEGSTIRLSRSRHLVVDLWDSRRQIADARAHEDNGDLGAALGAYQAAVASWRGEVLGDLAYVDVVTGEREALGAGLVESACRGAELAVARRRCSVARDLAERALAHDPLGERAHRVLIAAAIAEGDLPAARAAVVRAEAAADELGVPLAAETLMLARQAR